MNHIYLGLTLSLFFFVFAYFTEFKVFVLAVLCVILAGLYFKDDFILFRHIGARVASFYSWICDLFAGIQNMYHQSNNTNFPIRNSVEKNGAVSRKFEKFHHGSSYNLSTPYVMDNQSLKSGLWGSGSKLSSSLNASNRTQSTLQEMSKLNINHRSRGETADRDSKSHNSLIGSPRKVTYTGYSGSTDLSRSGSLSFTSAGGLHHSTNIENKPPLSAK